MEEEEFFDTVDDQEEERGPEVFESVYELHKAAYNNDVGHLKRLLQRMPQDQYTQLDLHGNTALHVAAMRGHTPAVEVLLEAGLPAKTRSSRGWTAFDEACAARAMPVARVLQQRMLLDAKMEMKQKRAQLLDSMQQMPDYSLQLKWQLGSSVPGLGMLLRKYAPHDTYTIWKVGNKLRVDGSLMGISTSSIVPEWKRGHFSLIVDGSPEGIAAAAAAAEQAMGAARQAVKQKSQRKQQQRQKWQPPEEDPGVGTVQEQQQQQAATAGEAAAGGAGSSGGSVSPAPAPVTPGGSSTAEGQQHAADLPAASPAAAAAGGSSSAEAAGAASSSDGGCGSSGVGASSSSGAAGGQQDNSRSSGSGSGGGRSPKQQQQFFDAEPDPGPAAAQPPAPSGPGGPRLLFLNHGKGSWVDLSADKKALKLEAEAEEEKELDTELYAAMQADMEKLRLKPRNFKFAPVKGWLGGDMTEKVEGWKCTVYEATGKLLAVSTSKARLQLSPTATFEDYLAAEYAADAVSETLIDPLTPSGFDMMNSKKDRSTKSSGGSMGGADSSVHSLGGDSEFDGTVWGSADSDPDPSSSSSSKKWGKKGATSSKESSKEASAAAEAGGSSGGGRVLRAKCWMAQSFPMSLAQLLPLLDVIGNANKHMAKVGKFLAKYSQMEMFPVKLQVPLLLTVHALVSFKAFTLLQPGSGEPALAPDFFTVPSSYKRKLLSEVMDKAGKGMFGSSSYGGDPDDDEWGLEPGGAGWFYGGDEGAEYMQEISERAAGAGQGAADSTSGRGYRIGSGLDEEA